MHVTERRSGDLAKLGALVRREPHAEQRYRLLAVVKAIDARERLAIAEPLSRSLAFVERWVYAHRDRGIEAIAARKRGGDRSKIKGVMAARLKARLDAGPGSVHGFVRHHFGSLDHNADHERHATQHTPARRAGRP